MEKLTRKPAKKSKGITFEEYLNSVLINCIFHFEGEVTPIKRDVLLPLMKQEHERVKNDIPFVGLFRLLQLCLQPVLETLILVDRLSFLRENGYSNSGLVQLFNPEISPRCVAVFALNDS